MFGPVHDCVEIFQLHVLFIGYIMCGQERPMLTFGCANCFPPCFASLCHKRLIKSSGGFFQSVASPHSIVAMHFNMAPVCDDRASVHSQSKQSASKPSEPSKPSDSPSEHSSEHSPSEHSPPTSHVKHEQHTSRGRRPARKQNVGYVIISSESQKPPQEPPVAREVDRHSASALVHDTMPDPMDTIINVATSFMNIRPGDHIIYTAHGSAKSQEGRAVHQIDDAHWRIFLTNDRQTDRFVDANNASIRLQDHILIAFLEGPHSGHRRYFRHEWLYPTDDESSARHFLIHAFTDVNVGTKASMHVYIYVYVMRIEPVIRLPNPTAHYSPCSALLAVASYHR